MIDEFIAEIDKSIYANVSISKQIISCDSCGGIGFKSKEECVDYHKRDYETIYSKCIKCEGCGRLTETTYKFSVNLPYPLSASTANKTVTVPYTDDPIDPGAWRLYNEYKRVGIKLL